MTALSQLPGAFVACALLAFGSAQALYDEKPAAAPFVALGAPGTHDRLVV